MTEIEIREGLAIGTIVTCNRDELARLIAKVTECQRRIDEAVRAEREACARMVLRHAIEDFDGPIRRGIAAAIRARGEKQ